MAAAVGEYVPIGSMVKDHILFNCGESNKARILIFTYMVHYTFKNNIVKVLGLIELLCYNSWLCFCFPPSLLLALSVVSMELFASHKMAEIRVSNKGAGSENSVYIP